MAKIKKVALDGTEVEVDEAKETAEEKALRLHEEAAAARVVKVTAEIEAEKVTREKLEAETGLEEGEGAKSDREASEAKRLEDAAKVLKVERVDGVGNSALDNDVIARLNEVIDILNK